MMMEGRAFSVKYPPMFSSQTGLQPWNDPLMKILFSYDLSKVTTVPALNSLRKVSSKIRIVGVTADKCILLF
jgi:hypothetical protein